MINYNVIKHAVEFNVSHDGQIYGLLIGDVSTHYHSYYESTGIKLDSFSTTAFNIGIDVMSRLGCHTVQLNDRVYMIPDRETTLARYGVEHTNAGVTHKQMFDGYWTPWHIADAEITRLQQLLDANNIKY